MRRSSSSGPARRRTCGGKSRRRWPGARPNASSSWRWGRRAPSPPSSDASRRPSALRLHRRRRPARGCLRHACDCCSRTDAPPARSSISTGHARPHEEPLVYRAHVVGCHAVAVPAVSRFAAGRVQDRVREARSSLGGEAEPDDGRAAGAFRRLVRAPSLLHGAHTQGLWYLAFFWLAFPIVLGWIDAVRLALLDDAQFQARLTI